MDRLHLMHVFARTVESGSFSATARELRIGQPNVSRHIAALERYLGTRLLHRSTRKLSLTSEGERYYSEARRVLDAVEQAESMVRGEDRPTGLLRVACPTALGRSHILPRMKLLLQRYPTLDLDLQVGDRFIDLIEEGVDVAIRIGVLEDSSLRARRVGSAERVCVASPAYLADHPAPTVPQDLSSHKCIVYSLARGGNTWNFRSTDVSVSGRLKVNTPDGIQRAVRDGIGIAYAPVWLFEEELASGDLVALLLDEIGPVIPIHAVYPAKRLLPRRVMVFMDFIAEEFRRDPILNEGAILSTVRALRNRPIGTSRRRHRTT